MKKVMMLLSAFVALAILKADASDSCKILFNKKVIFKGNVEQENPHAYLKSAEFKKTDAVTIVYSSEQVNKGWVRTFYINGENEQQLKTIEMSKQTGSVSVKASVLNELKEKKQPVFIYTTSLPADKSLATRMRVRRMLICKIEWN